MEYEVIELNPISPKDTQIIKSGGNNTQSEPVVENITIPVISEAIEDLQEVKEEVKEELDLVKNIELKDEDVVSYLGKRYNKEIKSLDDLISVKEESEPLPSEVVAYMKYKKETGRGINDFIKLGVDFNEMNPDKLIKDYLSSTQEGLDEDDIDTLMEDYKYDEEMDDVSSVKKIKIEKKKIIAEAKKYFNAQKEKYKMPLESSSASILDEDKSAYDNYKQYIKDAKSLEEEGNRKRQFFAQKTNDIFNSEFKGFEFNINDKKITFAPGGADELKKNQSSINNFIDRFLDNQGLIKDAEGYHKALSIAMNPDKFAKFFYEQGNADATDNVTRKIKNINMSERRAPEIGRASADLKVEEIHSNSGRRLKIRTFNKI